jgi:hypothetical protein
VIVFYQFFLMDAPGMPMNSIAYALQMPGEMNFVVSGGYREKRRIRRVFFRSAAGEKSPAF